MMHWKLYVGSNMKMREIDRYFVYKYRDNIHFGQLIDYHHRVCPAYIVYLICNDTHRRIINEISYRVTKIKMDNVYGDL